MELRSKHWLVVNLLCLCRIHGFQFKPGLWAAAGYVTGTSVLEGSSSSDLRSSNGSISVSQPTSQAASATAAMSFSSPAASDVTQLSSPAGANLAPAPAPTSPTLPSTPFLKKTYELVDDPNTDDVISWSNEGKSFVIWSPDHLCQRLLLRYFKHSNFASFVRQLNSYGFRKISLERWEFANGDFQRGQKHLLRGIHRRRSSGVARPPAPLLPPLFAENYFRALSCGGVETGNSGVEDEIERLKKDKSMVMKELLSLQHQLDSTMGDLHTMSERLQTAETCQEHMIGFINKVMNYPGFLAQIRQQSSTGIAPENRGPIDVVEELSTSSSAVEHLYDSTARAALLSSNDIVSPRRRQHVSARGGQEAEMSIEEMRN